MHTASRLACRSSSGSATSIRRPVLCAFGLYAPLNEALLRDLGVAHVLGRSSRTTCAALHPGAGRRSNRCTDTTGRVHGSRLPGAGAAAQANRAAGGLPGPRSHGAAGAVALCQAARRQRDCASPATRKRAAAASIAAGIARSCRSTTDVSASCHSTSSWRTSVRRWPMAPDTSPSGIRTSSTASGTPTPSSAPSPQRFRTCPTTSRSRLSTSSHTPGCCRCSATPGARLSPARWSRLTTRFSEAGEGTHARGLRRGRAVVRRSPAGALADLRRVLAVDNDGRVLRPFAGD